MEKAGKLLASLQTARVPLSSMPSLLAFITRSPIETLSFGTAFTTTLGVPETAGSTTDWTYSSAVEGYQSPTAANVVNGVTYDLQPA